MDQDRERVMADVMAFFRSRIILTGAELDIFTVLDASPRTAEDAAGLKGCDKRGMEHLLDALAALGLLTKREGLFYVSAAGALLSSRHPETILPMMLHFNGLWNTWSRLTDVVKTGKPGRKQAGVPGEEDRRAFIGAMHAIGHNLALEIANAFDASRFQHLLDIGGASGSYTIAFLQKNPQLKAVLFDLPEVIPMARERLEGAGLDARATLVAGDFYKNDLPSGCDLALLSAIIHQNSPSQNTALYKKIFRALEPGGSILIRDHVMDDSRTKPIDGALFAINMLVNTAGGSTYTLREIKEGLEAAGFTDVHWIRKGERMDSLVEARKPG